MKFIRRALLLLLLLLAAASIALYFTARSAWFAEQIRMRIVNGWEQATGGKASLDGFRFDPRTWNVSVIGLTLHGTEAADEPPLVRIKSATIGWKIISLIDRRFNVESIDVDEPEVFIRRDAKGIWNLPLSQHESTVTPFDSFINLKAGRVHVASGLMRFEDLRIPFAFDAKDAEVMLKADAGEAYVGSARSTAIRITRPLFTPIDASLTGNVRLDHTGLQFSDAQIGFGHSTINAQGRMLSWTKPRLEASATGNVLLADIKRPLSLPMEPTGRATFQSKWALSETDVAGSGSLKGTGLDWAVGGVRIAPFTVDADWRVTKHEAFIDRGVVGLLSGTFTGKGGVTDWHDFAFEGDVADVAAANLYSLHDNRPFPWSATIAGPVSGHGTFPSLTAAKADFTIVRSEGATPVDGRVTFDYDVASNKLTFAPSHIELASSRAEFSGEANTRLNVNASSSNLDEILPAFRFFDGRDFKIPIALDNSKVQAEGAITNGDSFAGKMEAGRFTIRDTAYSGAFDSFRSSVVATQNLLQLDNLRIVQQGSAAAGSLRTSWKNGALSGTDSIGGDLQLTGIDLARVLRDAVGLIGADSPIVQAKLAGMANAAIQLSGTIDAPLARGEVRVVSGSAWGEPIDRLNTGFRVSHDRLTIESASVASGRSNANITGGYVPSGSSWRNGRATFNVTANEASIRRWAPSLPEGFEAAAQGTAKGEVSIAAGTLSLVALEGKANIPQLTLNGRPLGDATVDAVTTGQAMRAKVSARLLGSQVQGSGEFGLSGANEGLGQLQITGLTLENLRTLGIFGDIDRPLPARGSMDAEVAFRGPALHPDQWTAAIKIPRLSIEPRAAPDANGASAIDTARFTLHNAATLTGTLDHRGFTIDSARLIGEGTDLNIGGTLGLRSRTPWNLTLKGSFNLNGLSVLEPDLEASGVSNVDAVVRGELYRPTINGQMDISGAAFRFRNVPNGLDQVTGIVRFDTNRATIEKLTAQTGGGNLAVTGFVGFGGPQLVYRLQGDVRRVRIRYPDEVSTTFDGKLAMSGTSTQSQLSGEVIVSRIGLQAQADLGGLLASTARSAQSTPTQNAFLRGMQLDVHAVTAPDAELQTSLTKDLQPQADISIRGTGARPVALGRITLSEGELTFFGNRYRVNRGEINLYNQSRIEPIINFDLEATVRGVIVNINLNGPIDKLNPSYRSDPPLQPNEIISLLTVGRNPDTASTSQTTTTTTTAEQQSAGGGSLLGSALTAPVSGRLQRLFGISRINIDPDINSTSPQARLTVEQQVSREVRLTFIQTLSKSQSQIVRFQWDFSKDFSLIAVRDENGLFGMDFQYRKRFK